VRIEQIERMETKRTTEKRHLTTTKKAAVKGRNKVKKMEGRNERIHRREKRIKKQRKMKKEKARKLRS
jgi:hypothetical protein